MNDEEMKTYFDELKSELGDKITDDALRRELNTYLNEYRVTPDAAKRGIKRKYGVADTQSFSPAAGIIKKISELKGTEMNVDVVAKVLFVENKQITVRGASKMIISGQLGDETGTAPFTIWESDSMELDAGKTYCFKSVYTKKWNDKVQINLGARGKVEPSLTEVEASAPMAMPSGRTLKVSEITDGPGSLTLIAKIVSVESKEVTSKGVNKTIYHGILADSTGKIQFTAWNDLGLKESDVVCIKNAYIRSFRGIPQVNLGDNTEVTPSDEPIGDVVTADVFRTVSDIIENGGGLDQTICGRVIEVRQGSGLIYKCPECGRIVIDGACVNHGSVEGILDLRLRLVIDDGTGAISAIMNRENSEVLTRMTLNAARDFMNSGSGNITEIGRKMAESIIMRKLKVTGNVMSDDFGPSMVVQRHEVVACDVVAEAEKLYGEVEAAL